MKKSLSSLLLLSSFTVLIVAVCSWGASDRIKGNGNITEKTIHTKDYDKIVVIGSMDISVVPGREGEITVETDENLHEYLSFKMKGNTLTIGHKEDVKLSTHHGFHISLPCEEIEKFTIIGSGDISAQNIVKGEDMSFVISGSGDIEMPINAENVEVSIAGSGNIALSGEAFSLDVKIAGSGDFNGGDLLVKETLVSVAGSGDVRVNSTEKLDVKVTGSGDVIYSGSPKDKFIQTKGSGTVKTF